MNKKLTGRQLMLKPEPEVEPTYVQGQFEGMPAPAHLSGGLSEHEQRLKEIGETAPMMIRAPHEAISGITASGKILSQHDTGTSRGLLDEDERIGWEDQAFPDKPHHPIYGYLSHGEHRDSLDSHQLREYANTVVPDEVPDRTPMDSVTEYGDTAFELRPHIREHITFTHGDSLGRDPHQDKGRPSKLLARAGEAPQQQHWNLGADQVYTEMQVHPPGNEPGVDITRDVSQAVHYRDDRRLTRRMQELPEDLAPSHAEELQELVDTGSAEALSRENRVSNFLRSAGVPHEVRSFGETAQYPLRAEYPAKNSETWNDATPGPVVRNLEVNVLRRWKPGQEWEQRKPKRGNL